MTQHGRDIMLFIREDKPSKNLNADISISGIDNVLVETNLPSKKMAHLGSYNPHLKLLGTAKQKN